MSATATNSAIFLYNLYQRVQVNRCTVLCDLFFNIIMSVLIFGWWVILPVFLQWFDYHLKNQRVEIWVYSWSESIHNRESLHLLLSATCNIWLWYLSQNPAWSKLTRLTELRKPNINKYLGKLRKMVGPKLVDNSFYFWHGQFSLTRKNKIK